MGAETHKIDLICVRVKPYQKEITFYMALHVAGIIPRQRVRTVFFRYRLLIL